MFFCHYGCRWRQLQNSRHWQKRRGVVCSGRIDQPSCCVLASTKRQDAANVQFYAKFLQDAVGLHSHNQSLRDAANGSGKQLQGASPGMRLDSRVIYCAKQ